MSSFFDEFGDSASIDDLGNGPILAVDVGSTRTRVMLIEQVEGMYQFVAFGEAPSTYKKPWDNVLVGIATACEQITNTTSRAIIENDYQVIIPQRQPYVGVDHFIGTMSGGRPIAAMVVGLMPQVSMESVRRALGNVYIDIVDEYSLLDARPPEEFFNTIVTNTPDLIVITGGTNGGTVSALRKRIDLVATACGTLQPEYRPMILFAGNNEQTEYVEEVFAQVGVNLLIGSNPRPELDTEDLPGLTLDLSDLFTDYHLQKTSGYRSLYRWSGNSAPPSSQSYGQLIEVMGHLDNENVLGIDIGNRSTTIAAYINGELTLISFADLGVGQAARQAISVIPPENIHRWTVQTEISPDVLKEYFWNRALYPHTVPASVPEREMEYALVREIIREALSRLIDMLPARRLPNFDTILLGGAVLTRAPAPAVSVMAVLDVLGPNGFTRFLSDLYGIAPLMGELAVKNPQAFVQVIDTGAFIEMASVFATSSSGRDGNKVITGSVAIDGGNTLPISAMGNTLTIVPVGPGLTANVSFDTSGVNINMPKTDGKYQQTIVGSEVGLLFDTRSTPIKLSRRDEETRRKRLTTWYEAVSAPTQEVEETR